MMVDSMSATSRCLRRCSPSSGTRLTSIGRAASASAMRCLRGTTSAPGSAISRASQASPGASQLSRITSRPVSRRRPVSMVAASRVAAPGAPVSTRAWFVPGVIGACSLLRSLDGGADHRLGFGGLAPALHLHPLAGLQVLVVLEEVLHLLQRDLRQVGVVAHVLVALGELWH